MSKEYSDDYDRPISAGDFIHFSKGWDNGIAIIKKFGSTGNPSIVWFSTRNDDDVQYNEDRVTKYIQTGTYSIMKMEPEWAAAVLNRVPKVVAAFMRLRHDIWEGVVE